VPHRDPAGGEPEALQAFRNAKRPVHLVGGARVEIDSRKLRFGFTVEDGSGEVANGSHVRVIVDREAFVAGARQRRGRA
jgi:hypothetical protein